MASTSTRKTSTRRRAVQTSAVAPAGSNIQLYLNNPMTGVSVSIYGPLTHQAELLGLAETITDLTGAGA